MSLLFKKQKSNGLVTFYRIFMPCTMLSTESGKQRLTFCLTSSFLLCYPSTSFSCLPEKSVRFRIRLTLLFLLLNEFVNQSRIGQLEHKSDKTGYPLALDFLYFVNRQQRCSPRFDYHVWSNVLENIAKTFFP